MKILGKTALALGVSAAIVASAAYAAKSSNVDVAARQEMMGLVGHNIGILGSMAKGEIAFNAGLANASAGSLNMLAKIDPATLWTAGTEQGAADLSRAKAEIWSDPAGFAAKFTDMENAAATLMTVSDIDGLRAGMGALGGSCKGCHETYRGPKN